MPKTSILSVGDINADVLALLEKYPPVGGEGVARYAELRVGGSAVNTALALARLGFHSSVLSSAGDDPIGRFLLAKLAAEGVEVSLVRQNLSELTGIMFIAVTPDGERTIFGYRGANRLLDIPSPEALLEREFGWVHISGYTLMEDGPRRSVGTLLKAAHHKGVPVSLDMGMCVVEAAREAVMEMVPMVRMLLLNRSELLALTRATNITEGLNALFGAGARTVAVKLGDGGSLVTDVSSRELVKVPAFSVEVLDTTGAGDCFNAGLIAGTLWGLPLQSSALLGNALGGLACTVLGAGERVPAPSQVLELLQREEASPAWEPWREDFARLMEVLPSVSSEHEAERA